MRIVNFADGAESETTPVIGNIKASGLIEYPDDATYEATEQGAPAEGNIYFNTTDKVIRYYNGTTWQEVIDENTVQAVENKAIDADNNMITNIDNNDIKALAGIEATKIADGSVDDTEYQYLDGVTSAIQTQLNAKQETSEKGQINGYASLDGSGLVPAAQLPSYVDDVEEYANFAALPVTGETGKIYVTTDDNKTFRWTGSVYVEVGPASQANNNSLEEGGNLSWTEGSLTLSTPIQELAAPHNSSGWTMSNTTTMQAYNFSPVSTFLATGITIHWDNAVAATGNFVIEILPITGALPGEPDETTVLATTATIDASTVGIGSQKYNFVTPVSLTSGVNYAYKHRVTSTGTGSMVYDFNGGAPSGNYEYTTSDSGSSWSSSNNFAGTFEIHSDSVSNSDLVLSTDAYVQQEGFDKTRNTIQAQAISFAPTEDIAYVTVNKTTDAVTNLTVNTGTMSSYSPGDDDLIIARVIEGGVEIARKLYLTDGQTAELEDGIGLFSVDDLTDVDTTTSAPSVGEVLVWDGTNWAPAAQSIGSLAYTTKVADYTLLESDDIVTFTTGATDRTATLPDATAIATGKVYRIKKIDSGIGKLIIDGSGAQTIDSRLTFQLRQKDEHIEIVNNGTQWEIMSLGLNELIESSVGTSSTALPAVATWADLVSISLEPGIYDIIVNGNFDSSGNTNWALGISSTPGNVSPGTQGVDYALGTAPTNQSLTWHKYNVNVTSTTTYYAKSLRSTLGTEWGGKISARRIY